MSPRPPPKISLKHEWKRDLGSEHAQRPEVGELSRSSLSNQPTLIQFVRDRGDLMCKKEEKRPVLRRSMLLLFANNPVLQRTGRPVETSVIPTRSSEDRKDFNVEQTHERTVRPVITHDVIDVSDSSQTRSAHESETFNVEDEILRKKKEKSVADHDVRHESMMVNEADMDFRIPGLPHSVVGVRAE